MNTTNFRTITLMVILTTLLFLIHSLSIAQNIEPLDEYLRNTGTEESTKLNQLINGENSGLFIFDNQIEKEGTSNPIVANVTAEAINLLYSDREEFSEIELITITLRKENELSLKIDIDSLHAFPNLKYIRIVATFNICPSNVGNIECQKSKISKMISFSETTTNPTILFETISLM